MRIADAAERERALDPATSCIVQAPAGSGKTGLLIQRYLRLLATVDKPEEVLAITFTRKAAAEMRGRVLQALQSAQAGQAPAEAHAGHTFMLARDVLARDRGAGWQLLDNPARLRIQTIDSLSAALARQMPVLSRLGATPEIVEDARDLYQEAADRTLAQLQAGGGVAPHIEALLLHLDGDWGKLRDLLVSMLGRRDQWLGKVLGFQADGRAREVLEQTFRAERAKFLRRVRGLFPADAESELVQLARYAAANPAGDEASALGALAALAAFPSADEDGAKAWCALVELLLTSDRKDPCLRKSVNKNQGFPAGKGLESVAKQRMGELLDRLRAVEGLCEALNDLRRMPPATYDESQWQALGAVVALLPLAALQLQLVMAERGRIDFTGIARAAVQALGTPEEPTDLLLALDVKLRHLLVDEFQDTSLSQWELLALLTAGWQPGDGRTVFLVGDPMQSIYRFREADVSLFLRAWREGLGDVPLVPLRLSTNFRSRAGVVAWVNAHFRDILPPAEDADAGAVPYAPSQPHHPEGQGAAVTWHPFLGTDPALARDEEARAVVGLVKAALAEDGDQSVAVLVRNRANLDRIVPLLKKSGVAFRAVDIEPLGGRQVIQDLLAITRALSHPADRVAWLGLLRAPWCGLALADLNALAGPVLAREGARSTVWELMQDAARLAALSADGRARVSRLRETLAPFVAQRLRGSLCERVEAAWLALGGPACAQGEAELDDADTFLDQLDALEAAGEIPDVAVLEQQLERLYGAPDAGEEARVQLMTIHKAKGLEFGTVIVPGMDRVPRVSDRPLCLWKVRGTGAMMMAPIRRADRNEDAAYEYLRALERQASQHELERLLYVAATRTQNRLHLLGYARLQQKDGETTIRKVPENTLLGAAWSAARADFEGAIGRFLDRIDARAAKPVIRTMLRRLDPQAIAAALPPPAVPPRQLSIEDPAPAAFSWAGETARLVGTLAHAWLQRIALDGVHGWTEARVQSLAPRVERELARRGVPAADAPGVAARVCSVLRSALADERGRWVLQPRADARCEYRIRVATPEGVRLLIIDRMFTDAGVSWIVDYKTSTHGGAERDAFLESEKAKYFDQMARYAPAFRGAPGRLALYFPAIGGWREWAA